MHSFKIHHALNTIRGRFTMSQNILGQDSLIKIWRQDGVESWTTLEEGEFNMPIDDCIKKVLCYQVAIVKKCLELSKLFIIILGTCLCRFIL